VAIGRVVLREQVKDLILERILKGEYEPGERIVETRVAEELGISQAPVREALRDLELLRFVESEPFRGARVRAVTLEELMEIYPVRAALEQVAAQGAATRLTDKQLDALEREVKAMHAAADRGDLHAQAERDAAFHRIIVEACGNGILLDVWRSLGVEARTLITAMKTGIDGHEIAELHRPVIDALRSRNPRRAGAALRDHVLYFSKLLKGATQ
jgi:DNA-binding GntR family transcriptional regulator